MFTQKDRDTLDRLSVAFTVNMKQADLNDKLLNARLDHYEKRCEYLDEIAALKTKVELYEKFIAKMLESDPNKSNDVFMLDGEIYRLRNYHIDAEAGTQKILTVEFTCMSDITRIFKEADDT